MDLRAFKQAFGRPLEEVGFVRKGQTWFVDHEEVVVVVNLQKSQYSGESFLNLGFWLKALGRPPAMPPPEHLCHARVRAEALFPEIAPEISELLNRDTDTPDHERSAGLLRIMTEAVIPFLKEGATTVGLGTQVADGHFRRGLVHVDAKRLLGLA